VISWSQPYNSEDPFNPKCFQIYDQATEEELEDAIDWALRRVQPHYHENPQSASWIEGNFHRATKALYLLRKPKERSEIAELTGYDL
jgi:hypothetical protein